MANVVQCATHNICKRTANGMKPSKKEREDEIITTTHDSYRNQQKPQPMWCTFFYSALFETEQKRARFTRSMSASVEREIERELFYCFFLLLLLFYAYFMLPYTMSACYCTRTITILPFCALRSQARE